MHTVVLNPIFQTAAKAAGMTDAELDDLVNFLARNPKAGVPVQGTGGIRKFRFAKTGGGKSGGYRVFSYYAGLEWPVFLWTIISKSQSENLSKAERNALAKMTAQIIANYPRR
jgi:hypothetical protein